jgi:RNA polymerase sigma-70 factor (ECF subfamily)
VSDLPIAVPSTATLQALASTPSREEIQRAVVGFQAGEDRRGHFRTLHRFFHPRVERFLARRVFSPEERLDLNQEVFLRIYQNLEGFRGDGSLDGWVIRITQNVYRKWRNRQPGGPSAGPEMIRLEARQRLTETTVLHRSPQSPDVPGSPLEEVLGRERAERLRSAIGELPPRMRHALQMSVYQERSIREIADLLRVAPGTVKAHLFKAREALRAKLADQFDGLDLPSQEVER